MNNPLKAATAIAVVALTALAVTTGTAKAWTGNDFRSPSGNIRCHYNMYTGAVACGTMNDGFTVALSVYGGKPHQINDYTVYRFGGGPVLPYNTFWTARWVRCDSSFSGITCRATQTGHGFFLNRTSWNSW